MSVWINILYFPLFFPIWSPVNLIVIFLEKCFHLFSPTTVAWPSPWCSVCCSCCCWDSSLALWCGSLLSPSCPPGLLVKMNSALDLFLYSRLKYGNNVFFYCALIVVGAFVWFALHAYNTFFPDLFHLLSGIWHCYWQYTNYKNLSASITDIGFTTNFSFYLKVQETWLAFCELTQPF